MSKNEFARVLTAVSSKYYRTPATDVLAELGGNPNKVRALGQLTNALTVITPEEVAKFAGLSDYYPPQSVYNTSEVQSFENLNIPATLKNVLAFFEKERDSGRGKRNRFFAVCATMTEQLLAYYTYSHS
jgi:hypothetical protein